MATPPEPQSRYDLLRPAGFGTTPKTCPAVFKSTPNTCPNNLKITPSTCPQVIVDVSDDQVSTEKVLLHRVPPQARQKKKHIYEPLVVSLGPYHHHEPGHDQYEDFKGRVVPVVLGTGANPDFREEVRKRVHEVRSFYNEPKRYEDDEELVEMMLRDACLVVYNMRRVLQYPELVRHATQTIGAVGVTLMANDFSKLENQIPWWIITSLITSKYGHSEGKSLICAYLSYTNFWDYEKVKELPWEESQEESPPPHLLEARRRIYLKKKKKVMAKKINITTTGLTTELLRSPFRSATELRAKGIHFKKSSDFFDDISFVSHLLHGELWLPVLRVDSETATFLSNVIVLEMSPGNSSTDFPVTSYVNFMKSLIESPKDVKLLQEKGIIISYLMGNEQVVGVFREIDTHDVDNFDILKNIKMDIDRHCNNKRKTWMAELFDTYFRSPWTTLALIAAAFLLCLTFLQTFLHTESS